MSTEAQRLTNLLGAFAVSLTDAQVKTMSEASGLSPSAAAAIVSVGANAGLTVAGLAEIVSLTHSATVRLAADLGKKGLLLRRKGRDGRSVSLTLTAKGKALRSRLLTRREDALTSVISGLSVREQTLLERLLEKLTVPGISSRADAERFCRLCDEVACGGDSCPIEKKALRCEALGG